MNDHTRCLICQETKIKGVAPGVLVTCDDGCFTMVSYVSLYSKRITEERMNESRNVM